MYAAVELHLRATGERIMVFVGHILSYTTAEAGSWITSMSGFSYNVMESYDDVTRLIAKAMDDTLIRHAMRIN